MSEERGTRIKRTVQVSLDLEEYQAANTILKEIGIPFSRYVRLCCKALIQSKTLTAAELFQDTTVGAMELLDEAKKKKKRRR